MNEKEMIPWQEISPEVPAWFADAKFGLFFHWGPYSVPACQNEWYSRNMYAKGLEQNRFHEENYGSLHNFGYKDFYPKMTGEKFDPEEWAALVERSGAKYAGPVTEHCDNFSMWDSQVNPVNAVNYGPHRDVVGECTAAFKKRGIRTLATFHHQWLWGWFMSTDNEADVYDPANEVYYGPALPLETNRYEPYRYPDTLFCDTWRKKVAEVVEKYNPDALYFDSRTFIIDEQARYQMAKDFYEADAAKEHIITYKLEDFPRGIGVYDIECGRFSDPKPYVWQSDDRLEDNITWCIVQNPKYKSACRIIHQLCDIVSKNGNLLLNVGPHADGSFHPDAKKELYAIGDWLRINGEAIYGTRPYRVAGEGPTEVSDDNYDIAKLQKQLDTGDAVDVQGSLLSAEDIRFTTKGDTLYAIFMGWPQDGSFRIRTLGNKAWEAARLPQRHPYAIHMLGVNCALSFTQTIDALVITAPKERPCEHAFALKIVFA